MSDGFDRATVGEIVGHDYRTAAVFEHFGIDFCCGGRRSLAEACRTAAVDAVTVERALKAIPPDHHPNDDVMQWPITRLLDHIVGTHHAYIRTTLPSIGRYLVKLVEVHGARHPELNRIAASFDRMGRGLLQHMMKEERVLFPYVRELATTPPTHTSLASPFGTVENPIRMMEREHRDAGEEMRLIRELTDGYTVPTDGCATYRACCAELSQFERDLHRHVHLENNVLFPKALEVERHHAAR